MDFARLAALRQVRSVELSPDGRWVAYGLLVPRRPGHDERGRASFAEAFPVRGRALFDSFRLPALDAGDPAVMNDGRVIYTRWEYTDTPHFHTRLIFAMNPDGTHQKALFGSNVYWPNSIFFPRPIPRFRRYG